MWVVVHGIRLINLPIEYEDVVELHPLLDHDLYTKLNREQQARIVSNVYRARASEKLARFATYGDRSGQLPFARAMHDAETGLYDGELQPETDFSQAAGTLVDAVCDRLTSSIIAARCRLSASYREAHETTQLQIEAAIGFTTAD